MLTPDLFQPTIRKALPADAAAIAALTDAAYAKFIPRIGRKPRPMTADYGKKIDEDQVWLLAQDSQPAGVLVMSAEPDHLLIYSVAIDPIFQKRGFGRQLLAWAEAQALAQGYTSIRLYTNARFEENIRLYERLGYRETRREPVEDSHIVHMAKSLETLKGDV
jgi:ribosomal protein S18 acetylase RimI-like enzyme